MTTTKMSRHDEQYVPLQQRRRQQQQQPCDPMRGDSPKTTPLSLMLLGGESGSSRSRSAECAGLAPAPAHTHLLLTTAANIGTHLSTGCGDTGRGVPPRRESIHVMPIRVSSTPVIMINSSAAQRRTELHRCTQPKKLNASKSSKVMAVVSYWCVLLVLSSRGLCAPTTTKIVSQPHPEVPSAATKPQQPFTNGSPAAHREPQLHPHPHPHHQVIKTDQTAAGTLISEPIIIVNPAHHPAHHNQQQQQSSTHHETPDKRTADDESSVEDETILLVLAGEPSPSSIRRLMKRSGISDQRLAEIQMIRALKKQLERAATKIAAESSDNGGQEAGGSGSSGGEGAK